jgi:virulence-associated protein VapD
MSLLEEVRIAEAYERILIREELNEIFKMKPEAAKERAKEKLKQISADIKRAIDKHGEDSKTVQYLRAKKKTMHKELAHVMGEDAETCPEGQVWDEVLLECVTATPEQPEVLQTEEEMDCPEGQKWCPIQKKCVEPAKVGSMGPGRARGRMAEEESCLDGQVWDEAQGKCVEPDKKLKMADEALAIRKGASVETIANFLMKEFDISKKKAIEQAKEYYKKTQTKGFHNMRESLDEAKFKKKYGGRDLKYKLHFGMDLSELINLVRHKTFEELTRPGIPLDPKNKTHYNKVFTSVMNEIQLQFKQREEVALKDIRKILPEIIIDSLTLGEI